MRRVARELASPLGLVTVLAPLYFVTAARTVQGADNGEFCTLFATGGVAHPSGYPLYTLWLGMLSGLRASTPAQGAALATAILGLAAVALVHLAARAWGARPTSAALAASIYGLAPLAWDLATQAEVFTLNAVIAAAILMGAAPAGPVRGAARTAYLGLLAGLGLSNHHTIVLLAPIGLWGAWLGVRESRWKLRAMMLGVLAVLVGLLPYASIPLASPGDIANRWVWGNVRTFPDVLAHFRRADYGTTRLVVGSVRPRPLHQIAGLLRRLLVDFRVIVPAGALAFFAGEARRRDRALPPLGTACLCASFLLSGPVFASVSGAGEGPSADAIARRFQLLPGLLLTVPFALGIDPLVRRATPLVRGVALASVLLGSIALGLPEIERERRPMLENYLVDTLRTAPRGAVVIGSGDEQVFGFLYVQLAIGLRQDVVFLSPIMLHYPWYHWRISGALGFELPRPKNGSLDTVELSAQILAHGRRLFLTDEGNFAIVKRFTTFPYGTLLEVLPPSVPPPPPEQVESANLDLFPQYSIDPVVLEPDRAWSAIPRNAYTRPWHALAAAYARAGNPGAAALNARRATLSPWLENP